MTERELKIARERWSKHCQRIRDYTSVSDNESPAVRAKRIERARKDYEHFVEYYFPHYASVKCAKFQVEAAKKILQNESLNAAFIWPRGHAKSVHFTIMMPMWLKIQQPRGLNVMVLVSKSETMADTLLSDLQAEFLSNKRYVADFGPQYSAGSWEEGEFVTADNCAFFSRGRGQSPRGLRFREFRPDYIVCDDIDDDELCRNERRVREVTEWVKEALYGTMSIGGRGRFLVVGNMIAKNCVLANIEKSDGVFVSKIKALDAEGNPVWPEKWTREQAQAKADFMGYRAFQKEYMHNPITEGAVFRADWIRFKKLPHLKSYDHLIAYCDPSFKGSTKNDFKAIKMWGSIGSELHCIDAFCRQTSVTEMVRWYYDLHERLPEDVVCEYMMEANFMQDTILDEFEREGRARGYQLPIRGDKRDKPDKFARIEAVSPLWERGLTYYNLDKKEDPDMCTSLEQLLALEKGSASHDDGPDADEGAIWTLQKKARVESFQPRFGSRPRPKSSW